MRGWYDKQDQTQGLEEGNVENKIIVEDNLIFADTRDCIGSQSLLNAQDIYTFRGGKKGISRFCN